MTTTFNAEYSTLYDLIYADKNYAKEAEFILNLFDQPVTSLLDYGCGTGRHSHEFSKKSIEVVGFDPSPTMLDLAKIRAKNNSANIAFLDHLDFKNKFSHIACLFAVFDYIPGKTNALEALQMMRKSLQPKGQVALEMWNGFAVPFLSEREKTKDIVTSKGVVTRKTQTDLNWLEQILTVNFQCLLPDGNRIEESHKMYYYTPKEMHEMAKEAGFKIKKMLPAYETREAELKDYNLIYLLEALDV